MLLLRCHRQRYFFALFAAALLVGATYAAAANVTAEALPC